MEKFKPSNAVDAWRRAWLPTPVFLPGEFHGQRSLAGCSPWICKELDTTERQTLSLFFSYAIDGNAKSCNCYGKQYDNSSKHLKKNYVPDNPLLDIYPNELKWESQRSIYSLIFIAALFATTKIQKNKPKCPSRKE